VSLQEEAEEITGRWTNCLQTEWWFSVFKLTAEQNGVLRCPGVALVW